MKRLVQYIKEGKGRGLKAMLIFSVVAALLLWGAYYPGLKQVPTMNPNLKIGNTTFLHLGFIFGSVVFSWGLFLLTVGLSALVCKLFKLNLKKGTVWRSATVSMIILAVVVAFTSLIGVLLLKTLMAILPTTQNTMMALIVLNPVITLTIFFVTVVTLIAFAVCENKKEK